MDFEFIDESEIQHSRRGRPGKKKEEKRKTLFDSELTDRSYWGVIGEKDGKPIIDPGTELAMSLMRIKIRQSVANAKLIDIDDHYLSRRLSYQFIDELWKFQMSYMMELVMEEKIIALKDENGDWVLGKIVSNND